MTSNDAKYLCLFHGAGEIVQVTDKVVDRVLGADMTNVHELKKEPTDAYGFSLAVSKDGHILDIGRDNVINAKYPDTDFEHVYNVKNKVLMPGFVDAHTHPVWDGDRVHEFAMKLAGATYMEVHQAGGGINFTVEKTKAASHETLLKNFLQIADGMLSCGTTLLEAKSGYGLDIETEVKMLEVLDMARDRTPIEISSTYCGAHAVPKNKSADAATEDIVKNHIPVLRTKMESGLCVENVDVFCEEGVFDIDQSERILKECNKELGLKINFHGDELNPTGSAELAGKLNARAVSHLEEISEDGIEALAKSGTVAVILPTTAYILRLKPPAVRHMIASGVPVALGSDFNPNAYCYSMPMVLHLACVLLHMSLEEALVAATINAAASLGRGRTHGALQVGRVADLLVVDAPDWRHLIYRIACHNSLIKAVIKSGQVVYGGL